jgi:DNA-binding response OmpR family regulator
MIWIVTNHPKTGSDLAPLITARGYQVATIECGEEVYKRIRFQTPSLVILDCGLPDSFEVLAGIRTHAPTKPIPVIMFSIDDKNVKDQALARGADAYVPKGSLDWAELLAQVIRFAGSPENPTQS